jgi:hypothetical protein
VPSDERHAVLVGPPEPRISRLRVLLQQAGFSISDAPDAVSALDRVWGSACDLVIVNHPVGGLDPRDLIATVRHPSSPSRSTGLVLIVPPEEYEEARSLQGRGANRVVARGSTPDGLLHAVGDLLDISPRHPVRGVVEIEATKGDHTTRALMRTIDLSLSGMLLQGDQELAVGDDFNFELHLPGVDTAIVGRAKVVRHTDGRENVTGVGASFADLEEHDRLSLLKYLSSDDN